jgi:hypothetical protein
VTTGHVSMIETRRSLPTLQPTPFTTCRVDAWSLGYQEGRRHRGQRTRTRHRARLNPPLNLSITPPQLALLEVEKSERPLSMATNLGGRGKYPRLSSREQEDKNEAFEAYLLDHVPGLKNYYAAQHEAFLRIEEDALARHPDPTPDDIAAAEAAEAALPSRKRMEVQLRRSFTPLAAHLPSEVKRSRKRFVQRHQRAWNRANPSPLTWELERALTAEFMKTYGQ